MIYLDAKACDMLQEKLRNVYFERRLFPFCRLFGLVLAKQYLLLIDFKSEIYCWKRAL